MHSKIYCISPNVLTDTILSITSLLSLGTLQCNSFTYCMHWVFVAGSFVAFASYIYFTFIVPGLFITVLYFHCAFLLVCHNFTFKHYISKVKFLHCSSKWVYGSVSVTWIVLNHSCPTFLRRGPDCRKFKRSGPLVELRNYRLQKWHRSLIYYKL